MLINVRKLKAAAIAGGDEETRYYLQGVYIEPMRDDIRLTGTNGHVLICARQDYHDDDGLTARPAPFIMPADLIVKIKLTKKHGLKTFAAVTFDQATLHITIEFDGATYGAKAIDGTYPNYRNVIPAEAPTPAEPGHYDSKYLAALDKAAVLLGAPRAVIAQAGESPALVKLGDADAFGVLMPLRADKCVPLQRRPAWADERPAG
jgi:hypothetical protein